MTDEPPSVWSREAADRPEPAPSVESPTDCESDTADTADAEPPTEFTAIFGSPNAVRPLGQESVDHRRRGMANAAGGGETLDRRQRGASDDVLVTLLAHPAVAAERVVEGTAFSASRRLRVDIAGRRSERRDVVFDASLRTVLWHRRAARLRVYGSASMNVTVLTLTPAVARRRPSRWFVRAGNRAMEQVAERLADEVEPLRWQPPVPA